MRIGLPFPNKGIISPAITQDRVFELKGVLDKSLKGKKAIFKGMTEEDILEIRGMLIKEVKRQNEHS